MLRVPGIGKGVHGVQFLVHCTAGEEKGHLAFSPTLFQFFLLPGGKKIGDVLLEMQAEGT